jgi:hypothetical protein
MPRRIAAPSRTRRAVVSSHTRGNSSCGSTALRHTRGNSSCGNSALRTSGTMPLAAAGWSSYLRLRTGAAASRALRGASTARPASRIAIGPRMRSIPWSRIPPPSLGPAAREPHPLPPPRGPMSPPATPNPATPPIGPNLAPTGMSRAPPLRPPRAAAEASASDPQPRIPPPSCMPPTPGSPPTPGMWPSRADTGSRIPPTGSSATVRLATSREVNEICSRPGEWEVSGHVRSYRSARAASASRSLSNSTKHTDLMRLSQNHVMSRLPFPSVPCKASRSCLSVNGRFSPSICVSHHRQRYARPHEACRTSHAADLCGAHPGALCAEDIPNTGGTHTNFLRSGRTLRPSPRRRACEHRASIMRAGRA